MLVSGRSHPCRWRAAPLRVSRTLQGPPGRVTAVSWLHRLCGRHCDGGGLGEDPPGSVTAACSVGTWLKGLPPRTCGSQYPWPNELCPSRNPIIQAKNTITDYPAEQWRAVFANSEAENQLPISQPMSLPWGILSRAPGTSLPLHPSPPARVVGQGGQRGGVEEGGTPPFIPEVQGSPIQVGPSLSGSPLEGGRAAAGVGPNGSCFLSTH